MAAGDKTAARTVTGALAGLKVYATEVVANGTTAVEVNVPFERVVHCQLTFAEAPSNGTTSELWWTVSGSVVSIDCAAACGTKKVSVLVLGY